MNRRQLHEEFVHRFGASSPASIERIREEDLATAETRFGVLFPRAYREFVLSAGAIRTPSILYQAVAQGDDLSDVSRFFAPAETVETTESYRTAGMSTRLVAFAIDCLGNVFCFAGGDLRDPQRDDAPVWFFDHDCGQDRKVADSFDAWLTLFVKLP